jgi:hypothetical protein
MRLRQSNERLDVQADKSRMVAGILGDMASEGVGNEWDRFSHNAKGNPLMYGIDAFNRATAGMSGGEALEDTVNMLNPNPNLTAEYGPVAAPADLAAITMGTALTPSRLLGSGIRTAIKSMEKRIPGALAKLAITGGAPTAAKVGMDNLGYDYAGGGGVQSGSQSTGSTSDLLNNNALLEWVRRMIPNAVDIYGNTPSEGAMQPRPKPVELLQSMNRSAPSGGESGGVSAAGIGSMLGGLGKIAGAFGGAGGATAAGSGMGFAHGGYVEPEDRHQRLGAPTIDDEMMAYGVMNYADGGYVPGFSMGGGNLFDPNKWDRETGGGGLGGDLFNLLNSDPRFAAALSSANGTDSSGMGTSAAAPAPAPAETGGGGFGGIINTLAGGDGGVGGLLPMLLKGLGVGGGGGKSGGMDIASLLSPAMAIGKGTGLFAEGGYVPGFADGGMMSGLLGDPSQTQAMYAEWLKTHPPMDPNTPGFGQATPDDFGNGQQYGIPPTGQQGLGAMPQAASMPAAPMASTPSGPGQGVLANMAAASGLQQSTAMGGGRGALSGGDQPMRGSINIQGSF